MTFYVQNASRGDDEEAQRLPAPGGWFLLMMRLDWPDEKAPSILDGTRQPPKVRKA